MRDIARQAGITDAAIYYHFESKRELLEALVEERGFLSSIQNLRLLTPELPLAETLVYTARNAVNLMDENREFLRLIIMEGLGGDEAALEQHGRLLDRWEDALTTLLQRYEDKGELPGNGAQDVSRQVIYTILMAFQESLLGRNTTPGASATERRDQISAFVGPAIERLLRGLPAHV